MWPFNRNTAADDPELRKAEHHVRDLVHRASQVEQHLRPRHERNHWSEAVHELWRGGPA